MHGAAITLQTLTLGDFIMGAEPTWQKICDPERDDGEINQS